MAFTLQQRKEAYEKLSPEIQDFIMDNETTDLIQNYLKEVRLTEEQTDSADSEIMYALLGLQTFANTYANIAKLSNKNINDLATLKNKLDANIFSKVKKNNNLPPNNNQQKQSQPSAPKQDKVGDSFEQAILNQAKAMMVAQENKPISTPTQAPSNLPTEPEMKIDTSIPKQYPGGNDPYREAPE